MFLNETLDAGFDAALACRHAEHFIGTETMVMVNGRIYKALLLHMAIR